MAQANLTHQNSFYSRYYHHVLITIIVLIILLMCALGVVLYQLFNRPLPLFYAVEANGSKMELTAYQEPNLQPDTIIRFATKAATAAYTFDFVNYIAQVNAVEQYFTSSGFEDYVASIRGLLSTIVSNQLFVTGVVVGSPVISNQGPLPQASYAWRVQIPFLVTYQSANTVSKQNFYVILNIVRVPTTTNPQGIGIDQFVMM